MGNQNLNGKEKFSEATQVVKNLANQQGIQVSNKAAQSLVQAAYENSPLTPTVQVDENEAPNTVVDGFKNKEEKKNA